MGFYVSGDTIAFNDETTGYNIQFTTEDLIQAGIEASKETMESAVVELNSAMKEFSNALVAHGNTIDINTGLLDYVYKFVSKNNGIPVFNGGGTGLGYLSLSEILVTGANSILRDHFIDGESLLQAFVSQGVSKIVSVSIGFTFGKLGELFKLFGADLGLSIFSVEYANNTGELYNKFIDSLWKDKIFRGDVLDIIFNSNPQMPYNVASLGDIQGINQSNGEYVTSWQLVRVDPIVLDLDGDGVEKTSIENGVYFDFANDGFSEKSAWISSDDGFLVYDKNEDGVINDGSEMFGDMTTTEAGSLAKDGFEAMKDFDSNNDGKLSADDANFDKLKVWRDKNSDGITQNDELYSLSELNIKEISTGEPESILGRIEDLAPPSEAPPGYRWVQVQVWIPGLDSLSLSRDIIMNDFKQSEPDYVVGGESSYTTTDGTVKTIEDIFFATDKFDTKEEEIAVSEEIERLPDIASVGTLHSFHQLMARDEEFKNIVIDFICEDDILKQYSKINDVLYKWADVSSVENNVNPKLKFIEKYFGTSIKVDASKIDSIFNSIKKNIFNQLMLKSNYSWIGNFIDSITNTDGTKTLDFTPLKSVFEFLFIVENNEKIIDIYSKISSIIKSSTIYESSNFLEIEKSLILEHEELEQKIKDYNLISISEVGSSFNDVISTGEGNDTIYGGIGDDSIVAGSGNDLITGETGNDFLQGGIGNDTYIFNKGDGQDTIYDHLDYNSGDNNYHAGTDTLKFGEGITVSDLILKQKESGIEIGIKKEGKTFEELADKIYIKCQDNVNARIENFEFADGTKLSFTEFNKNLATQLADKINWYSSALEVNTLAGDDIISTGEYNDIINAGEGNDIVNAGNGNNIIHGNEGDDKLNTGNGSDTIYGDNGNDTINSSNGNDSVYGGEGNDTIDTGYGDDIITGGKGNDFLAGSGNNDIYIFNKGDGQDTIYDHLDYNSGDNNYHAGTDTLKFGEGITVSDLILKQKESGIEIGIKEEGKTFEELADKIYIKCQDNVNARIEFFEFADGTKFDMNNLIVTSTANDTIIANEKNNLIFSNEGNDTIKGGLGNDFLHGGSGDDTYIFNSGDGQDTIIDSIGEDKIITNINPLDIIFSKYNQDLEMSVNGSTDKITIKDWETTGKIEKFEVSNNQYISMDKVEELIQAMSAFGAQNEGITWENALKEKKEEVGLTIGSYYKSIN